MSEEREANEIDRIVDRVIDDRSKARELKRALHDATGRQDWRVVIQDHDDEEEDLWDDVPV